MKHISSILLILCFLLSACQEITPTKVDVVIKDVSYLDVIDGIWKQGDVGVLGNTIRLAKDNEQLISDKEILAKGKYLIPGLTEMHAHVPVTPSEDEPIVSETMFLYLANGVTLIRGMLGHESHLRLREKLTSGEIDGPRLVTSGPSLNGRSTPTPASADSLIRAQKILGFDFLKMHPGLSLPTFEKAMATANEVGIPYSGHVSQEVGIRKAIAAKYGTIDHLDGFLEGTLPVNYDKSKMVFFGLTFADQIDESKLDELIKLCLDAEVAVIPTQAMMERWTRPEVYSWETLEDYFKYLNPVVVDRWIQSQTGIVAHPRYSPERHKQFVAFRRKLIKKLSDAGVQILLGSDSPQVYNVPGFSIHLEMELMVASGMTPLQVIQSGTVEPAKFFGFTSSGEIKDGFEADMLLLNGDPLADISSTKNIHTVFNNGQEISKAEIEKKLALIAAKYER